MTANKLANYVFLHRLKMHIGMIKQKIIILIIKNYNNRNNKGNKANNDKIIIIDPSL